MIRSIKNSRQLGPILAIAFLVTAIATAFILYSLPADLGLTAGYERVLNKVYLTAALTLIIGAAAIYLALIAKEEIIVYRTRTADEAAANNQQAEEHQKGTISLDSIHSLQGGESKKALYQNFLQLVCDELEAGQGAFYEAYESEGIRKIRLVAGYALAVGEGSEVTYDFGEGLVGQSASEGKTLLVDDIPEGYIKIISGLGTASPRYLLIVPVKKDGNVRGVIEIASFKDISEHQRNYADQAASVLTDKIPDLAT